MTLWFADGAGENLVAESARPGGAGGPARARGRTRRRPRPGACAARAADAAPRQRRRCTSISTTAGLLTLDLSRAFQQGFKGGSRAEELAVGSLVADDRLRCPGGEARAARLQRRSARLARRSRSARSSTRDSRLVTRKPPHARDLRSPSHRRLRLRHRRPHRRAGAVSDACRTKPSSISATPRSLPYGNKSQETVTRFKPRDHLVPGAAEREDASSSPANTASSHALETLRARYDVPVYRRDRAGLARGGRRQPGRPGSASSARSPPSAAAPTSRRSSAWLPARACSSRACPLFVPARRGGAGSSTRSRAMWRSNISRSCAPPTSRA